MQRPFPGRPARVGALLTAAAAALLLVASASARPQTATDLTDTCATSGGGGVSLDGGALVSDGIVSGCGTTADTVDWSVYPDYTGASYDDNTAAAAAEPAPPAPVTVPLPTWRNLYDWPNGHGYAGWHSSASPFAGAYGMQSALGGQYGLWLWPVGDQWYDQTEYAEWTYTAPGTTRLASAQLSFAYRNKLLAHHCIDVGFRTASGAVTSVNTHCQPAKPPDSQRNVDVSLVDPASNPTSKVLFFRIRLACNGSQTTCSKNIPSLDPLQNGGYARLLRADLTLVDDDNPVLQRVSESVDGYNDTYSVSVNATDAGSGVKSVKIERVGGPVFASADAPCDPTHHTDALDNRICPQSFTLNGTLDISDLEDGTYTFRATAVDVAGNVGTLTWTVTIDRVSLDVTINPLTATSRDRYTSATQNDFGWTASERVPSSSTRQRYKWRFTLAPGQTLELLSNGALAVVTLGADDSTNAFVDDYSDGPPEDPSTVDPSADVPDDPNGTDGDFVDDDPTNEDPDTWTPVSTGDVEGMLDIVAAAQDEVTDGSVEAIVRPPVARDAAGHSVAASFSIAGNIATLTISHQGGGYAYPVTASADLIDVAGDSTDDASANPLSALRTVATAAVTCGPTRPKIVVYGEAGWASIVQAFEANPTTCADYYINLSSPPPRTDPDTGKVTSWEPKRHPRAAQFAQAIYCAANADPSVQAAGARFFPMAEFNWTAWRHWVNAGRGTWREAGIQFRALMKSEGGFGNPQAACPNGSVIPERWSLNELPSTWAAPAKDRTGTVINPQDVRNRVREAVIGLFTGPTGYKHVRGFPFVYARGNAQVQGFQIYRPGLRTALQHARFWNTMKGAVAYWGQEAYTNGFKNLIDGAAVPRRAKYTNAYTLHPADFAYSAATTSASGSTQAARSFFSTHYYPLLNGFCCSAAPYGWTQDLTWAQLRALVSLQLYAARRHATGASASTAASSTANRLYPHLNVGIAWHEEARTLTKPEQCAPFGLTAPCDNPSYEPNLGVARHIAQAIAAAYDPVTGTANKACTFDGSGTNWCAIAAHTPPNPHVPGEIAKFNPCWFQFQSWTAPNRNCG